MNRFPRLFEAGYIGKLKIRNRIVMAPMATGFEDSDGTISQRQIDYLVARAKGGTGLILTGAARVDRVVESPPTWTVPWMDEDIHIAKASDLVESVHDFGAKICIQLSAGLGRQADWSSPERVPIAPSAVPSFTNPNAVCRALTIKEIKKIIKAHAAAAHRVLMAGYDMIEFHAHTGYLTDEFMSTQWNKRKDRYGRDFEGRIRFALEIVEAVRTVVGPDFPLSFRLTADHKIPNGRTLDESIEIAKRLQVAGIDVLHVDGGCYDAMPWIFPPCYFPEGCMVDLASAVRKAVSIPIIAVGNIKRPEFAERILREGKADFVCLGRQLIADSHWANKARDGRVNDIRPCIMCNEYCIGREFGYRPISCSVDPTVGKERYYSITRAEKAKKVMVVGGGPAGMEAARVAALRGHQVVLYEKENELGGQLRAASKPEFKNVLGTLTRHLTHQLKMLGVRVHKGKEVTPKTIEQVNPNVVVLATGAKPLYYTIPGIRNQNVITAVDLHLGKRNAGKNILVAGGGLTGCDTALSLALEGKKVTIVEMCPEVARDLNSVSRMALLDKLAEMGVTILTRLKITEFTAKGVLAIDDSGKEHSLVADTIVLAMGSESEKTLADQVVDKVNELYLVGDCSCPGKVGEAIHEGFVAGWRI